MAWLLCALMFFAAFVLLAGQLLHQRRRQRLVARRLQGQLGSENRLGNWLQQIGSSRLGQRSLNLDSETRLLLDRMGWRRSRQRALFAACQVGVPFLALGLGIALQETLYRDSQVPWLVVPFCAMVRAICCPSACWRGPLCVASNRSPAKFRPSYPC